MIYEGLSKALRERAQRENNWYEHAGDIINAAADAIEALQAQLPKRGEWVYNDGDYIPYCSICGMPHDIETPYCHFCGAKMEVQS